MRPYAMTRLEHLELIATLAANLRNLERMLTTATDTRLVMNRLSETRQMLDEALDDLKRSEQQA